MIISQVSYRTNGPLVMLLILECKLLRSGEVNWEYRHDPGTRFLAHWCVYRMGMP